MIHREMQKKHFTATDLSRKLHLHLSTVTGMLNRPTIQVQKLADLCGVFQYNFFREIAEQLPYEQPKYDEESKQREMELLEKIAQLEEENKTLKIKVEVLKDVVDGFK